jgi:cobalt-precorrin 5A hydrolase
MVGGEAVIVAGIGCRRACAAADIVALVRRALATADAAAAVLAAPDFRSDEPGTALAARSLGLPLTFVERELLAAAEPRCATRSARAAETTGLASVAEAAALAAAGPGATLVLPRIAGPRVTCALARTDLP